MGSILRRCIIGIVLVGLVSPIHAQQIFKTKWKGIAVQSFSPGNKPIIKFTTYKSGDWAYLKAHTQDNSQDIVKACWKGVAFQDFSFPSGEWLKGFEISEPDVEGWVCLKAVSNTGSKEEILKTKMKGSAVQGYTAPTNQWIKGFTAEKPGEEAILSAEIGNVVGIEEDGDKQEELSSALFPIIPNPSPGCPNVFYTIPKTVTVSLNVYDCSGKIIKSLVKDYQNAGKYELMWDRKDSRGSKVSSGIYFFKLKAGDFSTTRKVILIK